MLSYIKRTKSKLRDENMAIVKIKFHVLLAVFLIPFCSTAMGSTPFECSSKFQFKNITQSREYLEMNPRFVQNGNQVVFLVFTGNPEAPNPWDYVLTKSDLGGHAAYYLSSKGVLDYTVLSNENAILLLKAVPATQAQNLPYEEIEDWELWYINLQTGKEVLLESSMGLPLSEGYKMLGLADLPHGRTGQIITTSPQNSKQLLIKRAQRNDFFFFNYFLLEKGGRQKQIFDTESWVSYSDLEWWPDIAWIDDISFLTLSFTSLPDEDFPQSDGLFSIVKVDLQDNSSTILYSDFTIRAFPKFALNSSGRDLYFQKSPEPDITELWRLNLINKDAEMIYRVQGDLGEVRISADESSLVFTQLWDNNCDIIRLDMQRDSLQQLTDR